MIALDRLGDEIFVARDPIVFIGDEEIAFLKERAGASDRQRARICAHKSPGDALHEMFIAMTSLSYVRPHRHRAKSESFHVVEGRVDVVLLDDSGDISGVIELGAAGTGRSRYYRLDESRFHTLLIRSDLLVLHEVTNGPFDRRLTEFAPFAPEESDHAAAAAYRMRIAEQVLRLAGKG
jgi:cupin fold WbuC family metalloprotein